MAKTAEASNGTKAGKTANVGFRPLGDKVLVRRDKAGDRTESGLYLPEKAKETPRIGTIVAAGTGRTNHKTGDLIPLSISKGDRVVSVDGVAVGAARDGLVRAQAVHPVRLQAARREPARAGRAAPRAAVPCQRAPGAVSADGRRGGARGA